MIRKRLLQCQCWAAASDPVLLDDCDVATYYRVLIPGRQQFRIEDLNVQLITNGLEDWHINCY